MVQGDGARRWRCGGICDDDVRDGSECMRSPRPRLFDCNVFPVRECTKEQIGD